MKTQAQHLKPYQTIHFHSSKATNYKGLRPQPMEDTILHVFCDNGVVSVQVSSGLLLAFRPSELVTIATKEESLPMKNVNANPLKYQGVTLE